MSGSLGYVREGSPIFSDKLKCNPENTIISYKLLPNNNYRYNSEVNKNKKVITSPFNPIF